MSLAVTPEQVDFNSSVARWALERDARGATRRLLDEATYASEAVDDLWGQLVDFGWTGLLVPESLGGAGATWTDAAVLVEALASACAPLPIATTLAVTAVLANGGQDEAQALLKGVVDGSVRFAVGVPSASTLVAIAGLRATHVATTAGPDVVVHRRADVKLLERKLLDASSGSCELVVAGEPVLIVPGGAATLQNAMRVFLSADSVGVAGACLEMAVQYAQVREAFGRKIATFQAVKHHCANMLLSTQLASAATWRAAEAQGSPDLEPLAATAAYLAGNASLSCAKTTLQVLGGIGFTWEHDVHLYLRRAGANLAQLGPKENALARAGQAELDGRRPSSSLALPREADPHRAAAETFRNRVLQLPPDMRHALVVDEGYLHPQWPSPWGRAAGALEQIVIEEALRDVDRTSALGPTYWSVPIVLPTVLDCGTPEQIERWMRPSMMGEIRWCQLFSEPSAGSDLAALATRAVRAEGGWLVTGQKVWTSDAHHADLGMALVRTDPEAKKHKGITCLIVDMRSPGVDVRPLKQINGESHFNEVFLDEVFVPDSNVLGPVNGGWGVARTALSHERVSLAAPSNWTSGPEWQAVLDLARPAAADRPELLKQLGHIVHMAEGATALNLRSTYRALLGQSSGVEGPIGKTVVGDLAHCVGDFCLDVAGPAAVFIDGAESMAMTFFLQVRMATIAGGTSEVLRNLLAEQALGLPREPAVI